MDIVRLTSDAETIKQIIFMITEYMGEIIGNDAKEFFESLEEGDEIEYWGIFCGHELVGFCGLGSKVFNHSINLGYLAVRPEHRKSGIASSLLRRAEQEAKERNYKYIFVETFSSDRFKAARKFYRRMGYEYAGYIKGLLDTKVNSMYFKKRLYKKRIS